VPKKNNTGPRNKFEQSGYDQLKKAKVSFDYEKYKLPYTLSKQYVPDFTIRIGGHNYRYIEYKGYMRAVDQVKMKAVKKTNPDADIRFVFQDASKKIRKGAKLTYGEWALKYGFPFAEKIIPKSWLS